MGRTDKNVGTAQAVTGAGVSPQTATCGIQVISTKSGTRYSVTGLSKKGMLMVRRNGGKEQKVVAIYPDRLAAFQAATAWQDAPDGRLEGRNREGVRTCLLVKGQVRPGMILVSAHGLRSTEVVSVSR